MSWPKKRKYKGGKKKMFGEWWLRDHKLFGKSAFLPEKYEIPEKYGIEELLPENLVKELKIKL